MRRRTFLGMCFGALVGVGLTRSETAGSAPDRGALPDGAEFLQKGEEIMARPSEMVGYCGRLCMRCGVCGYMNAADVQALQNVAQTIDMTGRAEKGLAWEVMRDMVGHVCREFDGDLESYAGFVKKGFPGSCRDHCVPPCRIAACCSEKGCRTCAECAEMEVCAKLDKVRADMAPNLQAIRDKGLDSWAEEQWRKVTDEKKEVLCRAVAEAYRMPRSE